MSRMIFVNLPVKNLDKSIAFFKALGFTFNEQFTNEQAGYMVVNDQAAVMLVTEPFFNTFSDRTIADTATQIEVSNAVSVGSREEVDAVTAKAVAAGGREPKDGADEGFMYSRTFEDLDGHRWDVMWMDPGAIQG